VFASYPVRFTAVEMAAVTRSPGGWVDPRYGLCCFGKSKREDTSCCQKNSQNLSVVQPVAWLLYQRSCLKYSTISAGAGCLYRCADKSLARPTSRCILFDGENISFDASLVIYINSTNIPSIMIINRIYDTQNILSV
jgi:hypothetical protein